MHKSRIKKIKLLDSHNEKVRFDFLDQIQYHFKSDEKYECKDANNFHFDDFFRFNQKPINNLKMRLKIQLE